LEQATLKPEKIFKLLRKKAIQPVEYVLERDFYSNIFLVPKEDGGEGGGKDLLSTSKH